MTNRAWKACTRAVAAIAVGVLALTAGATAASASPAGLSALKAVPSRFEPVAGARPAAPLDGDVTAFHGFSSLQNIVVQSHGFDLEGEIHGRLRTFNFKSLWQVYNLPSSDSWKVWVVSFKHDSSRSVLKEVLHNEQLIDVNIDVKFRVAAANLRGVSSLRIGFETLRLQLDGQTKDFTVVNGASGGAKDQNNNDVPVDFQQV